MPLFNTKTLARHLNIKIIPTKHFGIVESWGEMVRSGRVFALKEIALQGQFASNLVEGVLGYHGPTYGAEYTVATEQTILRGSVDLALGRFGGSNPQIIAPLELKGADTRDLDAIMPGRNKSPVQQAWEYATNAPGVKWVIVSNMMELRLYGFGEGTTAYETFHLDRLTEPAEYARFMLLLSAEQLLGGGTKALLEQSRVEDRDITDNLYSDYKNLRVKLVGAVQAALPDIAALESISLAQKVLDRILFIAFAEDTGLLPEGTLSKAFSSRDAYNPRPVWDNFKGLFNAVDQGSQTLGIPRYNGGLFRTDHAVDSLLLPDDVCEGFKTLGSYDFGSEVSVTVLGHIFEQSIADVERLQAQARGEEIEDDRHSGTTGRRKRDGVVYTPDYIARFLVTETLGTHLNEAFSEILRSHAKAGASLQNYESILWRKKSSELETWQAYRRRLIGMRVIDPACGSGVFLISAFDYLKAELARVNEKIASLQGRSGYTQDLIDTDSEILTNNLFGVDVNVESVELAKLSLWIKTARRGKVLDSLSNNIRVGDSLIEDSNFAYLNHAFTWESAFPEVFAGGGFDVVIGNPPFVRMERISAMKPYLERRYAVVSDRADLYFYFYERGLRLLRTGGRLGFISSSTFLRNGSAKPLREFLLEHATIETIIDFGDIQLFEGVATLPVILTARRQQAPSGHELRFWRVEALPEANFRATWERASAPFPQDALGTESWELGNPALRALREKIRAGRPTLKEVFGSPLRGIVTGLNSAFVLDAATKERICRDDPKSAEILRPFLEGKDLRRWRIEARTLWLIHTPKNRIAIDDYPAVRDWLLPFRSQLEKRATVQKWFELQQAQEAYTSAFNSHKIVYSEFNRRYFALAGPGVYLNNKIFMMSSADPALLALLQSRLYWFLLTSVAPQVIGGSRELRAQYVEAVPIPTWNVATHERLAELSNQAVRAADGRLKAQVAFTRRIPDLCPPGRTLKLTTRLQEWWDLPDFATFRSEVKKVFKTDIPLAERSAWEDWMERGRNEIHHLSAEIATIEAKIDRLVYELFGLSAGEVELLESSTSP